MEEILFRVMAFSILVTYVYACALYRRPKTDPGKWALRLCLINVVCWVIVLILPTKGHPPPVVMIGFLLWVLNLPMLVAAIVALCVSFKTSEEDRSFLIGTILYLALNIFLLIIVPIIASLMT